MKKFYRTMSGVTLLEIMLVLAIAALVIIMSIRFYQSASTSNKVNSAASSIQSIVSAGENYLSGGGTLESIDTGIVPYLPSGKFPPSPWTGANSTIPGGGSSSNGTYTIQMEAPGSMTVSGVAQANSPCSMLAAQLHQNPAFTTACDGTNITVTVKTF